MTTVSGNNFKKPCPQLYDYSYLRLGPDSQVPILVAGKFRVGEPYLHELPDVFSSFE